MQTIRLIKAIVTTQRHCGEVKLLLVLLLVSFSSHTLAQTTKSYIDNDWPDSRYIKHSKTVIDRATGLMWKQCPEGQSDSSACADDGTKKEFSWQQALDHAQSVNVSGGFAGYNDWRVPNIKELQSLAAFDRHDPAINITYFPNTPSDYFWTSSPYAVNRSNFPQREVWYINFSDAYQYKASRSNAWRLRLVRNYQGDVDARRQE